MENTRRSFLKKMTAAGIGTAGLALSSNAAATVTTETSAEKKKKPAGKDDGKLRFGFIGTGSRCHEHINNVLSIPGNKIVAICDIQARSDPAYAGSYRQVQCSGSEGIYRQRT